MLRRRAIWAIGFAALVGMTALVLFTRKDETPPNPIWYCAATGEVRDAPDGRPLGGVTMRPFPLVKGSLHRGLLDSGPTLSNRVDDVLRGGHEIRGWMVEGTGDVAYAGGKSWERCDLTPLPR